MNIKFIIIHHISNRCSKRIFYEYFHELKCKVNPP